MIITKKRWKYRKTNKQSINNKCIPHKNNTLVVALLQFGLADHVIQGTAEDIKQLALPFGRDAQDPVQKARNVVVLIVVYIHVHFGQPFNSSLCG